MHFKENYGILSHSLSISGYDHRAYSGSSKFMQGHGSEHPKGKTNSVKQHKAQSALVSTMLLKKCLLKTDSSLSLVKSYLQPINLKNKNFTLFSIFILLSWMNYEQQKSQNLRKFIPVDRT